MKNNKVLTLIEILVIIVCIILIWSVLMPALYKKRPHPPRFYCSSKLKGLGTAMTIYGDDHDDNYPQLPGIGAWSKELGFAYDLKEPNFDSGSEQNNTGRTITASWYQLVREADVAPNSFVCPGSNQKEFDGKNQQNRDISELWDFGPDPYKHVSYAMHNPYGKFPGNTWGPATFAVAADMSPWFKDGNIIKSRYKNKLPQIIKLCEPSTWKLGNSTNHLLKRNDGGGQNVLYADGHVSYETQPNVGVNKDNIYTFQSTDKDPTEQDIQGGTNPTGRNPENDAKSKDDSFLAI